MSTGHFRIVTQSNFRWMVDYYKLLRLSRGASKQEVKAAYRKLALVYHPDMHGNNKEKTELFKQITIAYEHITKGIDGNEVSNGSSATGSSTSRCVASADNVICSRCSRINSSRDTDTYTMNTRVDMNQTGPVHIRGIQPERVSQKSPWILEYSTLQCGMPGTTERTQSLNQQSSKRRKHL